MTPTVTALASAGKDPAQEPSPPSIPVLAFSIGKPETGPESEYQWLSPPPDLDEEKLLAGMLWQVHAALAEPMIQDRAIVVFPVADSADEPLICVVVAERRTPTGRRHYLRLDAAVAPAADLIAAGRTALSLCWSNVWARIDDGVWSGPVVFEPDPPAPTLTQPDRALNAVARMLVKPRPDGRPEAKEAPSLERGAQLAHHALKRLTPAEAAKASFALGFSADPGETMAVLPTAPTLVVAVRHELSLKPLKSGGDGDGTASRRRSRGLKVETPAVAVAGATAAAPRPRASAFGKDHDTPMVFYTEDPTVRQKRVLIGLIIALFVASAGLIAARIHEANSVPPPTPKIARPKKHTTPSGNNTKSAAMRKKTARL
jgi:hypothetical protein